ncbi:Uncharacterised protein [Mycobacterium tuberculosis]|nr:Uncharacterised protein [Mycobacterium tuberculosis]
MAAWSLLPEACSEFRVFCRSATSVLSVASRCRSESSNTNRSAGRAVSSESPERVWRAWVTIAIPSTRHNTTASAPNANRVRPPRSS